MNASRPCATIVLSLALAVPSLPQSQCLRVNDDGLFDNGVALGFPVSQAAFKGTAPATLQVIGAEVFTGESSGSMRLELWDHDGVNNSPLAPLGTGGSWTMVRGNCWQGALFAQPITLQAGDEFWLVWNTTMFCQASFSTAAPNVDYVFSSNGGLTWTQQSPGVPYVRACKYRLLCAGPSGSVQTYGMGKPGTNGLVPAIGVCSYPVRGNRVELTCDLAARVAPGLLLVGTQTSVNIGIGTALVQPLISLPVMTSSIFTPSPISGYVSVTFPIPFDASLQGVPVSFQYWFADMGAVDGFSHSNGVTVTIG